uniref:Uncharacterized protein n=1 Tax=uncultured gamma proteobacterium EB000_65A11 TaxID=710972 RepID=E0XZZ7_9GAMM|nr:hypothetical protein [uncultured gamma proteobacterium EB000_65A11]
MNLRSLTKKPSHGKTPMLKPESSKFGLAKSVIQQHRLFAPESPCRVKAFGHLVRPENTG